MCDSGRCLLPVSVCDGHPNCQDQKDEANCSHKHKGERVQTTLALHLLPPNTNSFTECGGQKTGPYGFLSSPNHPRNYPHQQVGFRVRVTCVKPVSHSPSSVCQLCMWYLSAEEGHVITLSFRNFSLETQDVCEFDYVEVHDSTNTGSGRVLGR